jgi:hypothetical protein
VGQKSLHSIPQPQHQFFQTVHPDPPLRCLFWQTTQPGLVEGNSQKFANPRQSHLALDTAPLVADSEEIPE